MPTSSSHQHRSSTSLRQSNKKNKRSNASKRSVRRINGGRVSSSNSVGHGNARKHGGKKSGACARNKERRILFANQRRSLQRERLVQTRRFKSQGDDEVPRLVGVISLTAQDDTQSEHWEKTVPTLLQKYSKRSGTANVASEDRSTTKMDIVDGSSNKQDEERTFRFTDFSKKPIRVLTNSSSDGTSFSSHYNKQKKENELDTDDKNTGASLNNCYGDSAVLGALDLCRICDIVIFVLNGDVVLDSIEEQKGRRGCVTSASTMSLRSGKSGVTTTTSATTSDLCDHLLLSERGEKILSACKAQGLPSVLTLLTYNGISDACGDTICETPHHKEAAKIQKRSNEIKRFGQRLAKLEFGENVRFMDATLNNRRTFNKHSTNDVSAMIRFLCTGTTSPPKWVESIPRPYLVSFSQNYDNCTKQLKLSGYVQGNSPLRVDDLVHVPHLGTFALAKLTVTSTGEDILPTGKCENDNCLDMFATPDALEGEQNLIGFDEDGSNVSQQDNDMDDYHKEEEEALQRPAGWSDYQSAWLDGIDTDATDANELDRGELGKALNSRNNHDAHDDDDDNITMDMGDEEIDNEDKEELKRRRKEDLDFPDEVELQPTELARDRLARYRSLSSFRKSPWDPKENLPHDYGRVYHFSSFKHTEKDVMEERQDMIKAMLSKVDKNTARKKHHDSLSMETNCDNDDDDDGIVDGCVFPGTHVTLTISKVPNLLYRRQLSSKAPVAVVSLLPHENKVSVIHMGITSKMDSVDKNTVIKSKDTITFRCGWRTWKGRPIFSQNNLNSDKHKLERFLPPNGAFLAATVYGPVCYRPCPVLCFSSSGNIVAVGSTLGADADRIVIKRVVMTGYPTRVHKRHATVKYMFFNPEDVKWFQPAGLTSKHGLQGNILESVGDHGTMKCLFNKPIKQHDTVCLPLYKRIYPKFAPQPFPVEEEQTEDSNSSGKNTKIVMRDLVVL